MERYEKIDKDNLRVIIESENIVSKQKLLEIIDSSRKEQERLQKDIDWALNKLALLEK